jgi:hypothetical protein
MVLGAVWTPVASVKETSLFGTATASLAALRCLVADAVAWDDFEADTATAVARGFFTGAVVLPSESCPLAFAAVSRGFLEEVLFDCMSYILPVTNVFVSFCS